MARAACAAHPWTPDDDATPATEHACLRQLPAPLPSRPPHPRPRPPGASSTQPGGQRLRGCAAAAVTRGLIAAHTHPTSALCSGAASSAAECCRRRRAAQRACRRSRLASLPRRVGSTRRPRSTRLPRTATWRLLGCWWRRRPTSTRETRSARSRGADGTGRIGMRGRWSGARGRGGQRRRVRTSEWVCEGGG